MEKFKISSVWCDRLGRYIVKSNNGNKANCVYIDGEREGQEKVILKKNSDLIIRIHKNILVEKELKVKKSMGLTTRKAKKSKNDVKLDKSLQHKHYFTLGFLAKNGFLSMRTVPTTENRDGDRYNSIVGIYPWEEDLGYLFDDHPKTWSTKLFISFVGNEELFKLLYFPSELFHADNASHYYNNEWCWMLIEEKGFRLGRIHNIDRARETVPDEYKAIFDSGVSYNKEVA